MLHALLLTISLYCTYLSIYSSFELNLCRMDLSHNHHLYRTKYYL